VIARDSGTAGQYVGFDRFGRVVNQRLRQYQRGMLSSSGGSGGAGGGSITAAITLPNTDTQRTYLLDGLGNWRQTAFTPVAGSAETEVRQHNGLNQITRRQNPSAIPPLVNPTYDANGNLTNDGTRSYTWDALNRLVSAGSSARCFLAPPGHDGTQGNR
jgi:hypothetical protein